MARRHWLDPIARQLLVASGQLAPLRPPRSAPVARGPGEQRGDDADAVVERELVALKLRQDPQRPLADAAEVRLAAELGWRLDVNRASAADWRRLPGLEPVQLDLLLRLQAGGVQLSGPDDLAQLLDLGPDQLQCWLPVLAFRWYGTPPPSASQAAPLDLNRAGRKELESLGLSPERSARLLRERARRPFRDLADLQDRLQLPAALVEGWIGKVRFGNGPIGPVLPPRQRPA